MRAPNPLTRKGSRSAASVIGPPKLVAASARSSDGWAGAVSECHNVAVAANSSFACDEVIATAIEISQHHPLFLIGVGRRSRLVEYAASIGEVISPDAIRRACEAEARHVVNDMLSSVPANVAARHLICENWKDRRLQRGLEHYRCRVLVVGATDITSSQRRTIQRLTTTMSLNLVVV